MNLAVLNTTYSFETNLRQVEAESFSVIRYVQIKTRIKESFGTKCMLSSVIILQDELNNYYYCGITDI